MNRRLFLEIGALFPALLCRGSTQQLRLPTGRRVPDAVAKSLTTPNSGFPVVKPLFCGIFLPGNGSVTLLRTESWDQIVAQALQMAGSQQLSCFTAIQNMNRTWYYGAFQPGSAAYFMFQTPDSNEFQKAFADRRSTHQLVDFNVSWQFGQLLYSGCWIAMSSPKPQALVLDIQGFRQLVTQATQLSDNQQMPMQMTRVQAYPQLASSSFAALFEPASGIPLVHDFPVTAFAGEVEALTTNTLADVAYDPVAGYLVGCWQPLIQGAQFFIDRDWDTLTTNTPTGILQALTVYPDAPAFDDYFAANLAPYVMGYGYAVAKDGEIIGNGGGFARSSHETDSPGTLFTADSRLTLASVSKAITGVALEKLTLQKGISLDEPFLPLLGHAVTSPYPEVSTITLRQLARMESGLFQETDEGPPDLPQGTPDIWTEVENYLAMTPAGTAGVTYYYDNTNYSILQAVIQEQSGMDYTAYVTQNVLIPAGMNSQIINANPKIDQTPQTLVYGGPGDMNPGFAYGQITLVGVSGWVSSARELVKLLAALRQETVLPSPIVNEMFADSIGWNLPGNPASGPAPYNGNFGTYYWKEGGLTHNGQSLRTFLARLGEGYDLAVLVNSNLDAGSIDSICFNAFDARGLSAANQPQNGPVIQTAVNGASYMPSAAPGSLVAILGAGFTSASPVTWSTNEGTALPTELAGVQVRVGTVNAYVEYVSAGQVNVVLPPTIGTGVTNVEVTTPEGGNTASLDILPVAPGLFIYALAGKNYASATFAGTPGTIYVAPAGALDGVTSRPAKSGDIVQLFGTGMGPTNPLWPDLMFTGDYPAANLSEFQVMIGGVPCAVNGAAMIDPGVFQITITIPSGLSPGDQNVLVAVNEVSSQADVFLPVV